MKNPIIKKLFDDGAENYDWQRRHLIPCFDDFYGMALSLVNMDDSSLRILDLGAGTGLFSSLILQKYPNAQVTLMDYSDKMLDAARQRFRQVKNAQYIAADYSNYKFAEPYCPRQR